MNRIDAFLSDVAECEQLLAIDQCSFTDFCIDHLDNSLSCHWISYKTNRVCSITFIPSDDYPANCFLSRTWQEDRKELGTFIQTDVPLLQVLLQLVGELQQEDSLTESTTCQHKGDGDQSATEQLVEMAAAGNASAVEYVSVFDAAAAGGISQGAAAGRLSKTPAQAPPLPTRMDSELSSDSNLAYSDCEEYLDLKDSSKDVSDCDDDDDDFQCDDFDPSDLMEEEEVSDGEFQSGSTSDMDQGSGRGGCTGKDYGLDSVHSLLREDMERFLDWARRHSGKHNGTEKKLTPTFKTRIFEELGEVDVDIHVALDRLNLSQQLANAWKLSLEEPLIVRVNFDNVRFLDSFRPPKVEVLLPDKQQKGSVRPQIQNILRLFLDSLWSKKVASNDWLRNAVYIPFTSGAAAASAEHGMSLRAMESNVSRMVEMGFDDTAARMALTKTSNDLLEACNLLSGSPTSERPEVSNAGKKSKSSSSKMVKSRSDTNVKRKSFFPFFRGSSQDQPSSASDKNAGDKTASVKTASEKMEVVEPPPIPVHVSQTVPDLSQAGAAENSSDFGPDLTVKTMPSLEDGFLVMLYNYVCQRVPTLNDFCVVCDETHLFNPSMLMPAVCTRDLCLFSFQTLGVMADAASDMATGAEVVDLLVTMAKSASLSKRWELIFMPYPNIVNPSDPSKLVISEKKKDDSIRQVQSLMTKMPSVEKMRENSVSEMHEKLDKIEPLLYPLLNWIIASNRSHIVKLSPDKQFKIINTPHQYLLLSSPPAQERSFQKLKKQYGSTFAFHGSSIENWHSIIRQGLIVASGTKLQFNGAAYGKGIYVSPRAGVSTGYSGMGYGAYLKAPAPAKKQENEPSEAKTDDKSRRFLVPGTYTTCMALCEVIKSDRLQKKTHDIWTVNDEKHVCTRFFFVWEDGHRKSVDCDMSLNANINLVERALKSFFAPK